MAPILLLSDASSLQLLNQGRLTNNIFAEMGCFISSFPNLGVFYCLGSALFLADLFSCSFNKILLKGGSSISKEFAMLIPPLPFSPKQKILTPEMITDYLVANTPSEKLDTFPLYRPYDQIVNRYHTLKDFTKFQSGVYPEVDLLSSLYTGYNGNSLTQERLSEINE